MLTIKSKKAKQKQKQNQFFKITFAASLRSGGKQGKQYNSRNIYQQHLNCMNIIIDNNNTNMHLNNKALLWNKNILTITLKNCPSEFFCV